VPRFACSLQRKGAVASAGAVAAAAGVMFAGTAFVGSAATLATIGVYGLAKPLGCSAQVTLAKSGQATT